MSGNVKLALCHVVPDLVLKVLKGQDPLHILGDGDQVRHYTYGGDLAHGIRLAMESPAPSTTTSTSRPPVDDGPGAGRGDLAQGQRADEPFRFVSDPPFEHDVQLRVPDVRRRARCWGSRPPRRWTRCSTRSSRGSGGGRGRPALGVGVAAPDAPSAETGLSTVFGIRILARLGPARLTGLFGLLFWVGAMVWLPMTLRPDLIRPADLGSDTSNYAAAGERLARGSDLYALQAGDRPVPADNPPEWSVPILSPPAVGVLWAPLTLLPQPFELYTSWTVGMACTVALGVFLVLRLRPLLVLAILAPLMVLTLVAWSGNLYALLAPAFALVWWLSVRDRSRESEWLVGAIIGAATVLKLGPAVLLVWLMAGRRTSALASAAVTGLVSVAAAVWLGGVGIFRTYLDVVLHSAGTPAPLSIPGLLAGLGLPATAAPGSG